jgi:subtilase family serine protease
MRLGLTRTRFAVVATAAAGIAALLAGAASSLGSAQAASGRQAIPNTAPAWQAHAKNLGHAAPGAPVDARVYLTPNGGMARLEQAALAVSTPGNAQYRHFLTPKQYFQRFGTTDGAVSAVKSWLTGAGLHVASVEQHNRYVEVTGKVAAAEAAFGVQIDRYRHNGATVQAPTAALSAPASVAGAVLAVSGVDTTPSVVRPLAVPQRLPGPEPGFKNAGPCSAYYGEKLATDLPQFDGQTLPYAPCGYVGKQFRSAYEGDTSLDGSGITVAITDAYASPNIASDASTYAQQNGDGPYSSGQLTQILPRSYSHLGKCGAAGWYGEETLDVEAVHAMAQGAHIRYYGSASCYDDDFLDTFAKINDEGVVQLVTNSWGDVEGAERPSTIAAYQQAFLQGAMEGISYMFSSGDDGDELAATGTVQADYPVSDPYATAVGGTATAIGQSGSLDWETGWGTMKYGLSSDGTSWDALGFLYGSGGGESALFAKPTYQAGVTPGDTRSVPDVAMDADPTTGMLVGETQTFPDGVYYGQYRIGGTSLASPLFAGMTALALQNAGGGGVGLLNPSIYANAGAFTDVTGAGPDAGNIRVDYVNSFDASSGTVASVRTFDQDSSLTVTPGWDDVTGLGSPNSGWLTALG